MRDDRASTDYTSFAKILHWLVAALLIAQFALGWLMPKVRRGMEPGFSMRVHISIGIVVLALIVVRLLWRVTHRVAAEQALPRWQRQASATVHGLLYLLVFVTTFSGWFYVSARGWSLTFFDLFPLPVLVAQGSPSGQAIGEIHENIVWVLLVVIVVHVLAALVHAFVFRDQVMQRMLFVAATWRKPLDAAVRDASRTLETEEREHVGPVRKARRCGEARGELDGRSRSAPRGKMSRLVEEWRRRRSRHFRGHPMTRTSATVAFLPLCLVAALAFAQQSTPTHPQEPGLAAPQAQTDEAATSTNAGSHADRDARACLDFVTNIGVMRCAEKYRYRSARSSR